MDCFGESGSTHSWHDQPISLSRCPHRGFWRRERITAFSLPPLVPFHLGKPQRRSPVMSTEDVFASRIVASGKGVGTIAFVYHRLARHNSNLVRDRVTFSECPPLLNDSVYRDSCFVIHSRLVSAMLSAIHACVNGPSQINVAVFGQTHIIPGSISTSRENRVSSKIPFFPHFVSATVRKLMIHRLFDIVSVAILGHVRFCFPLLYRESSGLTLFAGRIY